jgi:hypothetical protein
MSAARHLLPGKSATMSRPEGHHMMGPAEMFDWLALRTKNWRREHTVPFGTLLTTRLFQAFRAWLPSLVPVGQ